jgi:hypothetical protein
VRLRRKKEYEDRQIKGKKIGQCDGGKDVEKRAGEI